MIRLGICVLLLSLQACNHGDPAREGFGGAAQTSVLLLDVTFEGKTVDAPVGTGGASAGEPSAVAPGPEAALVRDEPMPTRCLALRDRYGSAAPQVRFDFGEETGVTVGSLVIDVQLWFDAYDDYFLDVGDRGGANSFVRLSFRADGSVEHAVDGAAPRTVGAYQLGRVHAVQFVFRTDQATHDLLLDGVPALRNAVHGARSRGIGSLLLGCVQDADQEGRLFVDNLRANADPAARGSGAIGTQPHTLLDARFDGLTIDEAVGTGGAEAGEPAAVAPGPWAAIVRAAPFSTPSLELVDGYGQSAPEVRFEFLDGAAVSDGTVIVDAELWFHDRDGYFLRVGERDGSRRLLAGLAFEPDGSVACSHERGDAGVIGAYETGRPFPVRVVHRLWDGTFDVWLDGKLALEAEAHGVRDPAVGTITLGLARDADRAGRLSLDRLRADYTPLGPMIFVVPPNGSTLTAPTTMSVAREDLQRVEFGVDGSLKSVDEAAPFEWTLDPADYAEGAHDLTVRGVGVAGTDAVAFTLIFARPPPPGSVGKWERFVVAVENSTYAGNPFELEWSAVFTHTASGTKLTLPGFYAGDDTWKLAFMPTLTGEWTYVTSSSDADLSGRTGSLTCSESGRRGLLKADPDQARKWKYADGPYVVPLAFRFDVFHEAGTLQRFEEIADFLAKDVKGHMLEFTFRNEVFSDWESHEFDLDLWDRLDDRMALLAKRDLGIHFMIYSDDQQRPVWSAQSDTEKLLIRYLVARLAAYPVVVINTGIDIGEYRNGAWINWYGQQVRSLDPYGHPVSSRHGLSAQPDVMSGQTFSSEGDVVARIGTMIKHFQVNTVPVSMDDAWSENAPEAAKRGKDFSEHDIRRAAWKCVMAGGIGAIFRGSVLFNEDLWFRMQNFEEDLESEQWLRLVNPFVADQLGSTFGAMVPDSSLVANGYCLADPDRTLLLYFLMGKNDRYDAGDGGKVTVKLSGLSGEYAAKWFDPRSGQETALDTLSAGSDHSLTPPSEDDWVLLLTKE